MPPIFLQIEYHYEKKKGSILLYSLVVLTLIVLSNLTVLSRKKIEPYSDSSIQPKENRNVLKTRISVNFQNELVVPRIGNAFVSVKTHTKAKSFCQVR